MNSVSGVISDRPLRHLTQATEGNRRQRASHSSRNCQRSDGKASVSAGPRA
jgi:hypothetical protein